MYAQASRTAQLKAVYVYSFAKFIEWDDPKNPFLVIGLIGQTDVKEVLEQKLKSSPTLNGKQVVLKQVSSVKDLKDCHLIYVPESQLATLSNVLHEVGKGGKLVITETDQSGNGAPVSLVNATRGVRFKINKEALDKTGLKASAQLLQLSI